MIQKTVKVCHGKSCTERFSPYILDRLEKDREFYGYPAELVIEKCFCQGKCEVSPTVVFDGDIQTRMNPIRASELLRKKIQDWKKQSAK